MAHRLIVIILLAALVPSMVMPMGGVLCLCRLTGQEEDCRACGKSEDACCEKSCCAKKSSTSKSALPEKSGPKVPCACCVLVPATPPAFAPVNDTAADDVLALVGAWIDAAQTSALYIVESPNTGDMPPPVRAVPDIVTARALPLVI